MYRVAGQVDRHVGDVLGCAQVAEGDLIPEPIIEAPISALLSGRVTPSARPRSRWARRDRIHGNVVPRPPDRQCAGQRINPRPGRRRMCHLRPAPIVERHRRGDDLIPALLLREGVHRLASEKGPVEIGFDDGPPPVGG